MKLSIRNGIFHFLFIALLFNSAVLADSSDVTFIGSWRAVGEATESLVGDIHITATQISWDGSQYSPACSVTYKIIDSKTGNGHYPDEPPPFSTNVETSAFTTIKIQLDNVPCREEIAFMRLVIRPSLPNHLDVVAYGTSDSTIASFAFGRYLPDQDMTPHH